VSPRVVETFFAVAVNDMERARSFYAAVFGAEVTYASSGWTSIKIAGVRIGLYPREAPGADKMGLHFAVSDLAEACAAIERAGGRVLTREIDIAPGLRLAEVGDTEGNVFMLRGA
jgi:predicted enzyme related to lactoylglutathione lyase